MISRLLITVFVLLLSGCVIPGMEPDPRIAQREAEANAMGAACRYALRGIEDCYNINDGASKAHIFNGWKDMDGYMRENKIEGIRAAATPTEPVETIVEGKGAKTPATKPAVKASAPPAAH